MLHFIFKHYLNYSHLICARRSCRSLQESQRGVAKIETELKKLMSRSLTPVTGVWENKSRETTQLALSMGAPC